MTASFSPVSLADTPSSDVAAALDLVRLRSLTECTEGRRAVIIGLIDGPVATGLDDLPADRVQSIPGAQTATCAAPDSMACVHGTFVAAILSSRRTSQTPAICPGCTLLVRPVLPEGISTAGQVPSTTPEQLAQALVDCVVHGARLVNISLGVMHASARGDRALVDAIDAAARRGALVIAAAGNQGTLGSSALTSHPWVIPVAACGSDGRVLPLSNLGASIGRRGLAAPGVGVTSLLPGGPTMRGSGTSVATPFVTGALALLWSIFPAATAADLKQAVFQVHGRRPRSVVPPLLDAERAYAFLQRMTR